MKIKKLPSEFNAARPVLQTIEKAGFEAYFVGGSVRDTILNDPIHDVDIATSAYPSEVKALFKKTIDTGIKHGTVMILDHHEKYEVTTFRTESGYQDFRRPDKVTFVRSLSEDLKRRDFTVNALALKEDGTIIDLFSGLNDLDNHILRAVGKPEERFHEDALRMMRAIRFASKLDFTIERNTQEAIKHHAPLLKKIAVERILVEFEKMMMGQNLIKGVQYFIETGLFQYCPGLKNQQQALKKLLHINPNAQLTNTTQVWLLICRILKLSPKQSHQFLRNWKTSNELIASVEQGLRLADAIDKHQVNELILFQSGLFVVEQTTAVLALLDPNFKADDPIKAYHKLPIKSQQELAINGRDLLQAQIISPGPRLGKVLTDLRDEVLTNRIKNEKSILILEAQKLFLKLESE